MRPPEPTTMSLLRPSTAFSAPASPPAEGTWNAELPNTAVEILLELDGGWELDLDGHRASTRSFAAGLIAGPVRTRATDPVRLVQLSLDPLATVAVFGVPAGELAAGAVALEDLLGSDGPALLERIHDAGPGGGVAVAEAWIRSRLREAERERWSRAVPADVCRASALLRAGGGATRVAEVAGQLGCSRRHLSRRFVEFVGVGPSEFNRLVRFERASTALRQDPAQSLGALAHAAGFADQPHMNREFRAFADASPGAVAARFR